MKKFIFHLLLIFNIAILRAQTDNEFWFVAPMVTCNHECTPNHFVFTNANNSDAWVTISMPANTVSWPDQVVYVPKNSTKIWDCTTLQSKFVNQYNFTSNANKLNSSTPLSGINNNGLLIIAHSNNVTSLTTPSADPSRINITAYYDVGQTYNPEMFALKGKNALGTRFYTSFQTDLLNMSDPSWLNPAYSSFDIVFTENNTYITVTVPYGKFIYNTTNNGTTSTPLDGGAIVGGSKSYTLGPFMAGQTYSGAPAEHYAFENTSNTSVCSYSSHDHFGRSNRDHLAGIKIVTKNGKKIAITLKDDSMRSLTGTSWDLGGDQTVPIDLLGTEYVAMRGAFTNNSKITNGLYGQPHQNHYWYNPKLFASCTNNDPVAIERLYIMAVNPNTTIKINDTILKDTVGNVVTLQPGQQWTVPFVTKSVHILASDTVYVLQISGVGYEMGCPILPTISRCTGSNIVGFSASVVGGTNGQLFFNIMVRNGAQGSFLVNGNDEPIIDGATWTPIFDQSGNQVWQVTQIPYSTSTWKAQLASGGTMVIQNTKDVFHLGVLDGGPSTGVRFGYFSNYNQVNPYAFVSASGSNEVRICNGQSATIYSLGGIFYSWTPTSYLNNPSIPNPVASPPTRTVYTATVTGYCNDTAQTNITVDVAPALKAFYSVDKTFGCSPINVTIRDSSKNITQSNYWYNYNAATNANKPDTSIIFSKNGDTTLNNFIIKKRQFTNTSTITPDTFQIYHTMLEAIQAEGCRDTLKRDIIIYPKVTNSIISPLPPLNVCDSTNIAFTQSSQNATIYTWSFGDGNTSSISNPSNIFRNVTSFPITYSTRYIASSKFLCADTAAIPVTVQPRIKAGFTISASNGCADFTINPNNTSVNVTGYSWNFDDGVSSTLTNPTHIYTNNTSFAINRNLKLVVSNAGTCKDSLIRQLTVYPKVTAGFDQDSLKGCDSLKVQFTNTSVNTAASITYNWEFGDNTALTTTSPTNPSHQYIHISNSDITYPVSLKVISSDLCQAVVNSSVQVYALTKAAFTVDKTNGCSGYTSNITNTSEGGITNYLWNYGDGNTLNTTSFINPTKIYSTGSTPQNYTLSLLVNNSHGYCKSYYSVPITVNPGAAANFSVSSTGGCNPLTVGFTNTTDLSKTNKIRWEFGDGTSDSIYSPNHIYTNINSTDETYNVKLIAWSNSTGCIDTTINTITAYAYIQAAFLVSNTNICSNVPITFTNTSLGGITSSSWNFGDGHTSTLNSPVYSIKNTDTVPKNYNVKLMVQNSHACSKSDSAIVTVNPAISSSFKADNYAGCQPFTINLTNLSNIKNASTTTFNWNFGDGVGSTDLNTSHTYTNNTGSDITFPVKLTTVSSYSCTDDTTINFTVFSYVSTDFNFSKSVVCAQEPVTIFNNSSPGVTLSKWDFNNDGISETTINNKSFDTLFNNTKNDTLNYNVKLIGSNIHGCNATTVKTITVNPTAIASFIVKSPTSSIACQPHKVLFKNTSNIAGFSGTTSAWDFADGGTSSAGDTVTHTFFNPSSKDTVNNVQLKVYTKSQYGTCDNTASLPITTYAYVKAGFSVPNNLICSGNTIGFINSSSFVGASNANSFINKWDYLGNGTYSTNNLFNFSTTYNIPSTSVAPITYNVKLKVSDGNSHCFDSITHSVTIAPKVIAQFQPSPVAVCDSQNVKFTNNTYLVAQNVSGVKSYWDFGDGTSNYTTNSSSFNHLYTNSSTTDVSFPVKLTVVSPFNNCTDDTIINIPVYARTQADFNFTRSGICSDDSLQVNNYSIENSSTYTNYWSYGDGNTDNQKASVFSHFYINHTITPTTTNVRLIVQNSHSLCRDTLTRIATIYPKVVVDFAPHDTAGCQPLFVPQFLNKTNLVNVAGTQFNWDFGDSTNSNIANPSHQYINSGAKSLTYNVKLSVLSKYGCTGSFTSTATAYSYVAADFKLLNASACSGFPISIKDNCSSGVSIRNWDFDGNGSADSLNAKNTFNHIYINTTNNINNYNLTLIAKNNQGCLSTTKKVVTVYPKVTAGFTAASGCTPLQANITNTTNTVGTQFNWYFGDGSTSSAFNPIKTFYNYTPNDTNISIKLVAYSNYLCSDSITNNIHLYHRPVAEIGIDRYIGCSPFTPIFQNNSITSGATFTWDLGYNDPGSKVVTGDKTVSHTYYSNAANIISYKVILDAITPHWCDDTTSVIVNVYPSVTAKFDTVQRNCSPIDVLLNNKSSNAKYYLWNFGDSTTSNQIEPRKVFYNFNAGNRTFTIKLVASSEYNCSDSSIYNLVVFPTPVTNFTVDTSLRYYPNATFYFTNLTNPGPWIYDWNFKDGNHSSSSNENVSHTYVPWGKHKAWGIYNVVLTAKNAGCIDSTSQNVILDPPTPVASFVPLKSGCAPLWGYFNDSASMWADYYLWDFGDSTTSKSKYAYHTYYQPGIYNVKLTVTGDGGSDSHYETVNVYAKPVVDFDVQPTLVMIPDANIKCYNQSQNDSARLWYFGDGTTDTSKNPLHKYNKIGDYLVTLTAVTSHGCTDSSKNPIDIKVSAQGAILFPNAFTPNTNGPSDGHYTNLSDIIFHPYYEGVADYHLEIYDRWGELLFTSNDVTVGWDGYFKNRLCSQDVYVYKAWGRYYNGKTFEKAGDLTLLIRYNK